ncbi:uncharacterized protein FPOAC1_014117 [Fusarium poae]|uniref:uncharacterized protein n=1 Tax=Fusarium poae TaxID=36050 RepID=UPI001D040B8D|nr:uncharacterized protein FPOAC1_014113 [Fusarium poae]XP_044700594.1 uncharacterized protein FPOAC1_014115 [Fusarium poae]XP_044700596.1 uncharacterized protein FPOAC1_014117 [Fusarium poae]KAG8664089.1 hypothetical protein FPOAC1_014113 [Fusarium poae]KAG8664091.1 hypothetical protein FPOAC1_014115 [Fusarium poae]KAG8664093.1 hypothetical protein FPOAC1_014117 [Fusarium poae]
MMVFTLSSDAWGGCRVPPSVPFQPTPIQAPIFTKLNLPTLYPPSPEPEPDWQIPIQLSFSGKLSRQLFRNFYRKNNHAFPTPLI